MRIHSFKKPKDKSFIIDDIIENGKLLGFVASAGSGKSYILEYLAACTLYGYPFLGKKTHAGNVLLIDQDTPTDILESRMYEYIQHIESEGYEKIGTYDMISMKDLSLSDDSLIDEVKRHNAKLVIIDSLRSVCGGLNMSNDMHSLIKFKNEVLKDDMTIIFSHHTSEKKTVTVDRIMTSNDTGEFLMDDSRITQTLDGYFLIANPHKGEKTLTEFYIRPITKRSSIPFNPSVLSYHRNNEGALIEYVSDYDYTPQIEKDILYILGLPENEDGLTHKQMYNDVFAGIYGDNILRDTNAKLEEQGKILKVKGGKKNNAFVWRINND